jgi:hypothetical protein
LSRLCPHQHLAQAHPCSHCPQAAHCRRVPRLLQVHCLTCQQANRQANSAVKAHEPSQLAVQVLYKCMSVTELKEPRQAWPTSAPRAKTALTHQHSSAGRQQHTVGAPCHMWQRTAGRQKRSCAPQAGQAAHNSSCMNHGCSLLNRSFLSCSSEGLDADLSNASLTHEKTQACPAPQAHRCLNCNLDGQRCRSALCVVLGAHEYVTPSK